MPLLVPVLVRTRACARRRTRGLLVHTRVRSYVGRGPATGPPAVNAGARQECPDFQRHHHYYSLK